MLTVKEITDIIAELFEGGAEQVQELITKKVILLVRDSYEEGFEEGKSVGYDAGFDDSARKFR